MTVLYNCHTDGDNYRITKFNDGEIESSYLCSTTECQCPAGHRHSCRHRQMLPLFLARGAINSFWFLDFERKGWVMNEIGASDVYAEPIGLEVKDRKRSELDADPTELTIKTMISLPEGADIAEEFGKLLYPESEPAAKPSWRRV